MEILSLINFAAPLIVIFLTKILKRWISSKWAPLLVFALGGISTLIGVGPSPGADWIDKIINVGYVSGGATLIYDFFKKLKVQGSKLNAIILLLAFSFQLSAISGCASFESTTYKTMYTLGVTYDAGMKSANALYVSGRVSHENVAMIMQYADNYYVAYQEACVAFEIYKKTQTSQDKEKLITALRLVSEKHAEILTYIERLKR